MKLGSEVKLVWIAGPARTGSMWTFNVTRTLIAEAGLQVLPDVVPQRDEAMIGIANEGLQDSEVRRVRVLKVHQPIRADTPKSLFIVPRRDLRDALVSYMRFMRVNFSEGLKFVKSAVWLCEHYDSFPNDKVLSIKYEDILARPGDVVAEISSFLGLPTPERAIEECGRRFNKENVKTLISKMDEDIEQRIMMGQHIAQEEVVVIGPGNKRSFDLKTGFQTGHVSDYRDGDWRRILTLEQKRTLDREIGTARAAWRTRSASLSRSTNNINKGHLEQ